MTWDKKDKLPEKLLLQGQELSKEAYPKWLLDEVNEDLEEVRKIFVKFGVKVYRPEAFDINRMYVSPVRLEFY